MLSDLDSPGDPHLEATLTRVRDADVAVRIVPLVTDRDRQRIYARILGDGIFVDPDKLERTLPASAAVAQVEDRSELASPVPLILAGAAVLFLLALHEVVLARLPIPRREAR